MSQVLNEAIVEAVRSGLSIGQILYMINSRARRLGLGHLGMTEDEVRQIARDGGCAWVAVASDFKDGFAPWHMGEG